MANVFRIGGMAASGVLLAACSVGIASPMPGPGMRPSRARVHVLPSRAVGPQHLIGPAEPPQTASSTPGLDLNPTPVTVAAPPPISDVRSLKLDRDSQAQGPIGPVGSLAGDTSAVPEPASMMVWMIGLMGLVGLRMSLRNRGVLLAAIGSDEARRLVKPGSRISHGPCFRCDPGTGCAEDQVRDHRGLARRPT